MRAEGTVDGQACNSEIGSVYLNVWACTKCGLGIRGRAISLSTATPVATPVFGGLYIFCYFKPHYQRRNCAQIENRIRK